jgi:hypothetical protein
MGGVLEFPAPTTPVPRRAVSRQVLQSINGAQVVKSVLGEVENLPDPVEGTIYIVSQLVVQALPDRKDLLAPGELKRDDLGAIKYAEGFSC